MSTSSRLLTIRQDGPGKTAMIFISRSMRVGTVDTPTGLCRLPHHALLRMLTYLTCSHSYVWDTHSHTYTNLCVLGVLHTCSHTRPTNTHAHLFTHVCTHTHNNHLHSYMHIYAHLYRTDYTFIHCCIHKCTLACSPILKHTNYAKVPHSPNMACSICTTTCTMVL